MREFLIERAMPGVGQLAIGDLKATSLTLWAAQKERYPSIRWLRSYATKDVLYCVYRAPNEEVIREYAATSTLPVNRIGEVQATIDPFTIEDPDPQSSYFRQRTLEHARFCRYLAKMVDPPTRKRRSYACNDLRRGC